VFDATVNSQFDILWKILKRHRHFDKPNQDVNGVANLSLKSQPTGIVGTVTI
jgi:hypothetical protein